MNSKKWSVCLIVSVFFTLGAFAGLEFWLDPMLQYGTESLPLTSYEYSEMYSNPGIAKNYKYDAVMVGTSMIENTDVDLCDKLFGVNMLRLPYSGGTSFNMKTILDLCFTSNNDIEKVYWELDQFQLMGSAAEPRYPLPMYLYQTDHMQDVCYLLNLDIFYHYTLKNIINTLKGHHQNLERRGIILNGAFGKEEMLSTYSRTVKKKPYVDFESHYKKKVDKNLDNIASLIILNPNTEFVFFMPPFSVLYWDNTLRNGTFDANMDTVIYAIGELLKFDNVKIYFYQGNETIITNLDNYKDFSHYGSWISDEITELMAKEVGRMTLENYKSVVNNMREFVKKYDFEKIFEL